MPTYILDLLIRRAQIKQACNNLIRPVWLMVRSDGVHQAFNTKQISPCEVLQWDAPARLILNIQNIKESVLQVSLCTLNESYNQTIVVASSQILLSSLPFLNPKTISFPLMSSYDLSQTAAIVTFTATISLLPNPNEQKSQYQSNSMQQRNQYNQNPPPSYSNPYDQPQGYMQQQQTNYPQQNYQYNQPPAGNQYYQQPNQNNYYPQPQQRQMDLGYDPNNMPVNPYKTSHPQPGPVVAKKVHYPPFPPIEPDRSSVLYNVDERSMQFSQKANTPKVIHAKKGRKGK